MTREEAISHIKYSIKAYQNLIKNDARSGEAIGKDIKGEWKSEKTLADAYMKMIESLKMAIKALEQEPITKNEEKYCDRNICLKNEYNNIGCEDCEVTKSQEPMVEIDLYSVIKQKYIEREVLDKIRAEIETKYGQCSICEYDPDYGGRWYQVGDIADILQIIDKYKAENRATGNK